MLVEVSTYETWYFSIKLSILFLILPFNLIYKDISFSLDLKSFSDVSISSFDSIVNS